MVLEKSSEIPNDFFITVKLLSRQRGEGKEWDSFRGRYLIKQDLPLGTIESPSREALLIQKAPERQHAPRDLVIYREKTSTVHLSFTSPQQATHIPILAGF